MGLRRRRAPLQGGRRLTALLFLLLAARAAAEDYVLPPPPPVGAEVDYGADRADFDGEKSTLHLSGHVVVKESTMTVKGDDLWIDSARRTGRSDKPIFVQDMNSAVYGDSGEFDFGRQAGRLTHASAGMGAWTIRSRDAELETGRRTKYRTADFTSCDYKPPHYHFHGSSVYVVPKKYLLSWNTVFFLGPAPLFYMPVFYKSLDPDPMLKWQFHFGVDHRNGDYVKGTLIMRISSTTYSKIFDDYYSNMGFGYGAELDHHNGEDSRGSIYGYRIHEDRTINNRWGLFGSGYQNLGSSISFQGRLQFQSDPTFTNDYVRSDIFRLTPELINSAALAKTFSKGTVRVLYQRDDVFDQNRFVKKTEDLPRIEGQTTSLKIWKLPWINTFSGFADRNFTNGRDFIQKTVGGTWQGTRSFSIMRGLSYTPQLNYSETYYNRNDETIYRPPVTNQNLNSFQGVWTGVNNLRLHSPIGNIDATHTYSQRLKPDSLTQDAAPADKGVLQNGVGLADIFVPTSRTWFRVATGYDFRTFRDHVETFDQRVQPITTDASWQVPARRLIFTVHDDFQLGPGKGMNRSVITDVRWGDPTGTSVGAGMAYNLASPGTYYQSVDLAYSPSTATWRVSIGLRSLVESPGGFARAHSGRLFEKEITWTQRWHDFYTKVLGRIRPGGVRELTFNVELRFGSANARQAPRRDWESEWFPGRANDDNDLRP